MPATRDIPLTPRPQLRRTSSLLALRSQSANSLHQPQGISPVVRLIPLIFFFSYLTITVLLFCFGPWPFPVENSVSLYGFLIACQASLLVGYLSMAFKPARPSNLRSHPSQVVAWSSIVTLILLIPTSIYRTGSWIPNVVAGIMNPGEMYSISFDLRWNNSNPVEYLRLIAGPLMFPALPLGVFFWPQLRIVTRVLLAAAIGGTVSLFIAMGTNKAVADTIIMSSWCLMASYLAGVMRATARKKLAIASACVFCFAMFLSFFASGQASRYGAGAASGYFPVIDVRADSNHPLIKATPDSWHVGILGLSSYLTQGYYGLSLALQEPFTSSLGVGHSSFATRQLERLLDTDISSSTYTGKISTRGWTNNYWATLYPWIASDVSFPGTVVAMFFVGQILALSWIDAVGARNIFAIVMFGQCVILMFYIPANNQCFESGEAACSFWITLITWWMCRRLSNCRRIGEVASVRLARAG